MSQGQYVTAQKWIPYYINEETIGIAILHRLQHLKHLEDTLLGAENKNRNKETDVENIRRETVKSREAFAIHHRELRRLLSDKPVNGKWIRAFDLDRRDKDPVHGRTAAWWNDRKKCAETGGCCGSLCGCCEKSLREYLDPENGMTVKLYGHCSLECGCCIRSRGYYVPDKRLPSTTLGKHVRS
jgi:hypothetical protein